MSTRRSDEEIARELREKLEDVTRRQARKSDPMISRMLKLAEQCGDLACELKGGGDGDVLTETLEEAASELELNCRLRVMAFAELLAKK